MQAISEYFPAAKSMTQGSDSQNAGKFYAFFLQKFGSVYAGKNVKSFKYFSSILTNDGNVLVKLNVGLLWLKLPPTRRGLFLLAHWIWD
jgi:hypothetical protein